MLHLTRHWHRGNTHQSHGGTPPGTIRKQHVMGRTRRKGSPPRCGRERRLARPPWKHAEGPQEGNTGSPQDPVIPLQGTGRKQTTTLSVTAASRAGAQQGSTPTGHHVHIHTMEYYFDTNRNLDVCHTGGSLRASC